jgi:predicted DNA-binding transcriptional regulator AlpA
MPLHLTVKDAVVSDKCPLPPLEELRVIRLPQVLEATQLSRTRIRQLEVAGKFPRRLVLGDNAVAWREIAIRQWLADREGRSNKAAELAARLQSKPARKRAAKASRKGA